MEPLQRGWLEQPAVQERQPAQRAGVPRALARRPIERAEAQRVEHVALKRAARREGLVEPVDQVAAVSVQPALRLDEVEEQHPREGREGERMALAAAARFRQPVGEPLEHAAERLEEAGRDTLARERLGDAQRESERCLVRQRDAALEGGEEARRNAVERDGQRTNAEQRPAAVAPGRTHEQPRPAPHAQSAGEPALGALGESLRGAARGPLGILRLEAEHPVGLVACHQGRAPYARRYSLGGAEPGPGWHGLPRRLEPERAKKVA